MTAIRYSGLDPAGTWVIARTDKVADLRTWVYDLYRTGWRRLTVTDPADRGHVLATIGPNAEGGGRTWQVGT